MSVDLPWYLEGTQAKRYTSDYANDLKNRRTKVAKQSNEAIVDNGIETGTKNQNKLSLHESTRFDIPVKPFVGSLKDLIDRDAHTFQTQMDSGLKESWMEQVMNEITHKSCAIQIAITISFVGVGTIIYYKKIKTTQMFILRSNSDDDPTKKTKKKRKRKRKHQVMDMVTEESGLSSTTRENEKSTDVIIRKDDMFHQTNILDVFSQDVPKMADIISRSGLSRQESIKIAAQEVFAIQRLQNEESRRIEHERRTRLQMTAEASMHQIQEDMLSSIYGNRFLLCLSMSSLIRILVPNLSTVCRMLWNKDQVDVTSSLLHWILSLFCGTCTTESIECTSQKDMLLSLNTRSYVSSIILYYSGIEHFLPSAFIPSANAACITTIVTYFVATAFGHRLLRIFHSETLHRTWNILLMISFCLNTYVGQSLLFLVVQIFILNAALVVSIYIRIDHQIKHDNKDSDNAQTMELHHMQWIELSTRSSKTLKMMTMSIAVFLGFLPSFLKVIRLWI